MPLFIPIYAFVEVKTYDSFSRHWIKLNYLFIRIFRNDVYEKYDKWKAQLSEKLLKYVDEHGEQVIPDFQHERIVKPDQLHVQTPCIKIKKKQ